MSGTTSYNNEKVVQGEVEYPASDPASGAFFQPDYKKNEDLKLMLDGSKDSLKLEAMKRIIGLIAKGRDASDLFPAVVKNVVSKNLEVKKLVYVYLVRYAEEQQDLALLSISTFQRALKDPNQLIRASALRVLSSIRVPMIVPIVMLAIRDSASDMSPYVRKTAAHAIPKLYSLDPDQKEELVAIIDKLLSDKAPLVVGSAAMAFNEVCGDRMNLIHKSYRKLCLLLADVDEWGQLALLNVLTYYAKTCFPDPNNESCSSDSDNSSGRHSPRVEADLRLVLRAAKPLLQSRNSAVVLAVAQLFYHCGPVQEMPPVAKAMVRLLRAPSEIQSVVLNTIASLTVSRPSLFEPFLKSFFVRTSDPTHIKLLKLEILTNLATETSSPVVLREYQTYVTTSDKTFVAATIQAIGRLAVRIHSETETCLNGLLHLLSSKDEWVVCEAVVVVKRVVCGGASSARAAVSRAAKLLRSDRLAGGARAAAVWLVCEHGSQHARAAAVLAHMAESFAEQEELVKLQLLSLSVKLSVTQPATRPVCQYVLSLARYDSSYDVRDRARFLRSCLEGRLAEFAREICPDTPKPSVQANNKERTHYTVGSLSQYIGSCACGYRPLPTAPSADTCAALRDSAPAETEPERDMDQQKNKSFYSEPGSTSSSSSSSSEESTDEEDSNEADDKQEKAKQINNYKSSSSGTSDSESDSSSSQSDIDSETDHQQDGEEGDGADGDDKPPNKREPEVKEKNDKSNLELLLELDEVASSLPTMTPTCGGFLSPTTPQTENEDDSIVPVGPTHVPGEVELVSRVRWSGLGVSRRWLRAPHLYSDKMVAVQLKFTNHGHEDVENIRLEKKEVPPSRSIQEFPVIPRLAPGCSTTVLLGIDFADTIHPMDFTLASSNGSVSVSVSPPVGELVRAVRVSSAVWTKTCNALRGMNECSKETSNPGDENICRRVLEAANLCRAEGSEEMRFSGRSMSSRALVLVSVTRVEADRLAVVVRCENIALANLMAGHIATALDG
ncbi:AP-3 complex subunit beta-2 isoform X1 [Danaus plexippus]|uniref:AP-3 complex subunit beta-2 isoform X1 n=1 Tax=Danaus plexippus TaxID=13037 RepID=UPI002AB03654|nr:AP-3 complex subunit beta-2 isoform X1 [Danaus plexippus]